MAQAEYVEISAASVGYSYSPDVGIGSGYAFATEGTGRITAIRVWERPGSFITSLQLCYDYIWSARIGSAEGNLLELQLYDDESIIQVSGKHLNFIFQLIFVTSRGRLFYAGFPSGKTFNFYPTDKDAALRLLSGRYTSTGITGLGAHWGEVISCAPWFKARRRLQ
ncbi:zymogen granule membrane protein 16-like [Cheilinus undulatus]|uniref:zymogen granule membrane protein 16-like n=1 Tax=Cheilinus undulatus TaxID=241271 RepID=UPI001BD4C6F5|nr:zymogen granule membrane protein 16-like [Cheilinus undulatus]